MELLNLVAADLKRLKKDKSIRIILIVNLCVVLLLALIFLASKTVILNARIAENVEALEYAGMQMLMAMSVEDVKMLLNLAMAASTYQTMLSSGTFGLFAALAVSIFVGSEFSFNTIRNRIISGNSREKIYLSSFVSSLIILFVFYAINIAAQFIITTLFFGFVSTNGLILKTTLLAFLPYVGIVALVYFAVMATKSRSLGITLSILLVILLPAILLALVEGLASVKPLVAVLRLFPQQILAELLTFNQDVSEVGRLIVIEDMDKALVIRSLFSPPVFAALFILLGIWLFKRTDIK